MFRQVWKWLRSNDIIYTACLDQWKVCVLRRCACGRDLHPQANGEEYISGKLDVDHFTQSVMHAVNQALIKVEKPLNRALHSLIPSLTSQMEGLEDGDVYLQDGRPAGADGTFTPAQFQAEVLRQAEQMMDERTVMDLIQSHVHPFYFTAKATHSPPIREVLHIKSIQGPLSHTCCFC